MNAPAVMALRVCRADYADPAHAVAVLPAYRGQGIAEKMLQLVEEIALERGACKLTLEVLEGNAGAAKLYHRVGFVNYQLDPAMGSAQFLQKRLHPSS